MVVVVFNREGGQQVMVGRQVAREAAGVGFCFSGAGGVPGQAAKRIGGGTGETRQPPTAFPKGQVRRGW